jgi:hypothetical protein
MQATFIYMELAEMGYGVASLNLSLLLEKNDVFMTERTLLGQLGTEEFGSDFNINKQLALKYLQMSMLSRETEYEANFKIADFLYYGTSGVKDFEHAIALYK